MPPERKSDEGDTAHRMTRPDLAGTPSRSASPMWRAALTAVVAAVTGVACAPDAASDEAREGPGTTLTAGLATPSSTRPGRASTASGSGADGAMSGTEAGAFGRQSLDDSRATAIVRATARVAPAVVSVNVIRTQTVRPRSMWESLYLPRGAQRQSASFGSGVIVSPEGIILTNDHVISGASRISVTLADGRDMDAEVVGTDPVADIAVLRVRGENLPTAPVGSVDGLMIGEWAIAIGNPLGNYVGDSEPTVTAGVISAVDRNIAPSSDDAGFYFGMIQTDAAINPGNSGGALVNAAGEVIGINASILSRSGGSEGLGFAIPIDRALRITRDFLEVGSVRRAWLGLDVEPVEADEWGRTRGVRVAGIADGSPAANSGLRVGDRLILANDRSLTSPLDWEGVLLDLRAGDALDLVVQGRSEPVSLRATAFPSLTAARVTLFQGIELISVTPQIQLERGLTSTDGALIVDIAAESARDLGIRAGDVIVQMNRTRIRSADDAARFFQSLTGREGRVIVYLERNGQLGTRNLYWRG